MKYFFFLLIVFSGCVTTKDLGTPAYSDSDFMSHDNFDPSKISDDTRMQSKPDSLRLKYPIRIQ